MLPSWVPPDIRRYLNGDIGFFDINVASTLLFTCFVIVAKLFVFWLVRYWLPRSKLKAWCVKNLPNSVMFYLSLWLLFVFILIGGIVVIFPE